ncbi:DUF418 domain-containing protein [Marilutibacter maris]|uniref:Membrane protein n=1 Tax=Marilutibacter maris TaxID=1605891 RepID=A0A2U9TCN7_9GAMM|nr:DUF418 domain-containing protein [Lysobacter maris]AWV06010.1 Putative membrane protein [Lysobacter maris]
MVNGDRNDLVDTLRLLALFGICIVNIVFLGLPSEAALGMPAAGPDRIAAFLVEALFQAKFFLLFSFLFGWGIHVQARAARRVDACFGCRYFRRTGALALLGVLHALLVFTGDILLLYALLAVLFWPLRDLPPGRLLAIAAAMLPLALAMTIALGVSLPDGSPPEATSAGPGLGGDFADTVRARLADWPATFAFLLAFQGPLAFAAYAAGLAAAKSGWLERQAGPDGAWRQPQPLLPWLLAIGLPLNLAYAAVAGGWFDDADPMLQLLGFAAIVPGAPVLSAAYLLLAIRLSGGLRLPRWWRQAGRNSLSSYVLQGVLAGLVFGGYGLGLFGELGHARLLAVGLLVALAAVTAVGAIADRVGRGPLEAVLRRITYGRT